MVEKNPDLCREEVGHADRNERSGMMVDTSGITAAVNVGFPVFLPSREKAF